MRAREDKHRPKEPLYLGNGRWTFPARRAGLASGLGVLALAAGWGAGLGLLVALVAGGAS